MVSITLQDIKSKGSKALSDTTIQYLIVNSKMKSAIIPIDIYNDLIDALEELEDIKAIEERKNEKTIPFKGSLKASFKNVQN